MSTRDLLQDALSPLQVLDPLASGGMGDIHLARDPELRRTLAVKVLHSDLAADSEARERFAREARVVASLAHPNVVDIYNVGELADGTPYFVMDYVEGGSFAQRLEEEGPLSVPEARKVLGQVASALAAAHERGVVHRDIKASNVLFDHNSGRALVTDWGIAALDPTTDLSPDTRLTRAGTVVGSPHYMSPEQLAGDEVGPETDLYSLGLMAFELLTGKGPFPAETPRAIMTAHLRDDPPRLSEVRKGVDPELDALVARCLSKSPHERPTASELARLDPSGGASLEWPPPGLESLRGAAYKAAIRAGLPVLAACLPPMLWVALGPATPEAVSLVTEGATGSTLIILALLVSLSALAAGVGSLGKIVMATVRGARLGYGWRTLAETLADPRGDTGLLMTGSREYAVLDQNARRRLRTRRILGALTVLVLAIVGPPLLLVATALTVPDLWMLLLLGLGAAVAPQLLFREPRRLRAARAGFARTRASAEHAGSLVESWHQALPSGVGEDLDWRQPGWRVPVAGALAGLASVGVTALLGLSLMGILPPLIWSLGGFPEFTRVTSRWERVTPEAHRTLPPDPDIDPQEAGRLLRELLAWENVEAEWTVDRPPQATVEGSPVLAGTSPFGPPYQIQLDSLIRVAARGLSDAELAYLEGFTGDPRFGLYERIARAGALDWLATDTTFRSVSYFWAPLPRWREFREVGYAKIATAAWLTAQGRYDEAETALLEVHSAGMLLSQGTDLLMLLMGSVASGTALRHLAALYDLTGREGEARAIRESLESTEVTPGTDSLATSATVELLEAPEQTLREARLHYYRSAADTTLPRAIRWTYLTELVPITLCTEPRSLLLGPSEEFRRYLETLRPTLVRYPSDEDYFDVVVNRVEWAHDVLPRLLEGVETGPGRISGGDLALIRLVRIPAVVFGIPRLDSCLAHILLTG